MYITSDAGVGAAGRGDRYWKDYECAGVGQVAGEEATCVQYELEYRFVRLARRIQAC